MEAKTVLLININAILLISFCSDNWILLKIRPISPPHSCRISNLRQLSLLFCTNNSFALVEQHTNLYRQCNDLTEGYRNNVSRARQLYGSSCYWFLFDTQLTWRTLQTKWSIDVTCFLMASFSLAAQIAALYNCRNGQFDTVAKLLGVSAALFTLPILISVNIIHSTNTTQPKTEADMMYYAEAGWSLICATIGVILCSGCSYLYMAQSRRIRERQRSQRRRKQIHNAIMSACRQEIAMAIRARMTVI